MATATPSQQLENELNEVTYAVIDVHESEGQGGAGNRDDDDNNNNAIHELSSAINVRLSLEGNQHFPFVEFDNFDGLHEEEKIFLYGSSGSGKSRALFELVKKGIGRTRRIFVVNPRNKVGVESGRIPLRELLGKIGSDDVIVWDNFPDDLTRRDMANAKRVLELLSSKSVGKMIVVLKPKYLEVFRDLASDIPEFFVLEINYDKDQLKRIIQQYGMSIAQFKDLWKLYISSNVDRISRTLWSKEPTPLTVFDYYNELMSKCKTPTSASAAASAASGSSSSTSLDGVKEAEALLRS
ncbi:hypothetical protein, partial [Nitrososphaera sp.]|uniref:hypothetical protein n=1 Tax=Nitrososphaera sp. TaxID=1971748 RepID=UPI00307D6CE7